MNQELGQIFAKDAKFTIYSMGTENTGLYFACVPNELKSSLKVFVDLHKKSDFNMYREVNDPMKREELVGRLREVNNFVNGMNHSGVYVMPMIEISDVLSLDENAKNEEFNRVFKMIAGCTTEISSKLNNASNGEKTIEQAITIIEQTESDKIFIEWLKKQFPTFVMGVTLDDLRKQYQLEQQMGATQVNVLGQVNMDPINENVISNNVSSVQSNVNVSDDTIVSMAQNNVSNGNSLETVNNSSMVDRIQNQQVVQPSVDNISNQSNLVQNNVTSTVPPITQAPIVSIAPASEGIAPVDHSLDNVVQQHNNNKARVLVKTPNKMMSNVARAGFVKFPVFMLTIMAIGAFGIFIGKMFYMYLSQQ